MPSVDPPNPAGPIDRLLVGASRLLGTGLGDPLHRRYVATGVLAGLDAVAAFDLPGLSLAALGVAYLATWCLWRAWAVEEKRVSYEIEGRLRRDPTRRRLDGYDAALAIVELGALFPLLALAAPVEWNEAGVGLLAGTGIVFVIQAALLRQRRFQAAAADLLAPHLADLRSPDPRTRLAAVEALASLGGQRIVAPLTTALQDPERPVRLRAAETLSRMGSLAPDHPLLGGFQGVATRSDSALAPPPRPTDEERFRGFLSDLRDPSASVRMHATVALGETADPRAVEGLLPVLGDGDVTVRWCAAEALGKIADRRATTHLLARLEDAEEEEDVRLTAAAALGRIGDPGAIDALERLTRSDDEDETIRTAAREALEKLRP